MTLKAKESKNTGGGGNFEPLEAGLYPARLVAVADLGLQGGREYKGEKKPPVYEIMLTYELCDAFIKDEDGNDDPSKPRWLSERMALYPPTSEMAKSTKRLNALDPSNVTDGDFSQLIGSPCYVTIVQNPKADGRVFEKIENVAAARARDAATLPELVNKPVVFSLDEPDFEAFEMLPKWVQKLITENLNYEGSDLQAYIDGGSPSKGPSEQIVTFAEDLDDEVPY